MTPDRIRECLAMLHWSQRGLSDILRCDERRVRRWATGQYEMPEDQARWLERHAQAMEADPPPLENSARR